MTDTQAKQLAFAIEQAGKSACLGEARIAAAIKEAGTKIAEGICWSTLVVITCWIGMWVIVRIA